jgi:hypothetical protein
MKNRLDRKALINYFFRMNRERGRTFDDSSRMKILLPQNVSKMKVYRESLMAYHSGHSHAH